MAGLNLMEFLTSVGPLIAYGIVFAFVLAESGLLLGFVLPGDSLLLTAGLLASQGFLNLLILIPLVFIAAILGDNLGYHLGHRVGPSIFSRPDSRFFRREYLLRARAYYDRWGGTMVAAARFIPYLRTFIPTVAGAVAMEYRVFIAYNLLGALVWSVVVQVGGFLIGYWFGQIPGFNRDYSLLLLAGGLICALVLLFNLLKGKRRAIFAWLRRQPKRRWVSDEH